MDIKEEVRALDEMVKRLSLPHFVCSSRSNYSSKGIPGEMVFDHDGMFFVKRLASKRFGVDNPTLRGWSANDCKKFYTENNLSRYTWDEVEDGVEWMLTGRMGQYNHVFIERWSRGMLFTDYRERVTMIIDEMTENMVADCEEVAVTIKRMHANKAALNEELEYVVNNYEMSVEHEYG